jgi:hypothetical protein
MTGNRVTLAAEKRGDHDGSRLVFETEIVPYSMGMCVSTAPGLQVVPLCCVHAKTREKREVLLCFYMSTRSISSTVDPFERAALPCTVFRAFCRSWRTASRSSGPQGKAPRPRCP